MFARGATPEMRRTLPSSSASRWLPAAVEATWLPWPLVSPKPGSSRMLAAPQVLPGAPQTNVFYASNQEEAGQVLHGYQSAWLPDSLLQPIRQESLADALFAATRHWSVSLHTNKGLAGAPADAISIRPVVGQSIQKVGTKDPIDRRVEIKF